MKITNKKRILSALLLLVLAAALTLTSCTRVSSYESFLNAYEKGGNNPVGGVTPGGNPGGNIIIEGGDGIDVTYAATAGMRSAVSIYSAHTNDQLQSGSVGSVAVGSGVIYQLSADGSAFILTNYHVVYHNTYSAICNEISIYLYGMEMSEYAIPATFVGGSANYDLAVLRVEKSDVLRGAISRGAVSAATVADSDSILVGQTAIAVGNPEASGLSVTTGVVSVDSEYINLNIIEGQGKVETRVIRVDTAVNEGNSGCGLFNAKGELIGIINSKIIDSSVENIGYAIPSNVVRGVAENIIHNCYKKTCKTMMRPLLGVTVEVASMSTALDEERGTIVKTEQIRVREIEKGGLGESALKVGDVIRSITVGERTVKVTRMHHVIDSLLAGAAGDAVKIAITRNGVEQEVAFTLTTACLTAY